MGALAWWMLLLAAGAPVSPMEMGARETEDRPLASAAQPRVLFGGAHGAAARRAVSAARLRLMEPSCSQLLSHFKDSAGEPLQSRLDALGLSAPDYVTSVVFADGSTQRACRADAVLGTTRPGSRVVFLCRSFTEMEWKDARYGEAIVIHEMLHSLGLGENPPSSWEITTNVLRSCQGRPPSRAPRERSATAP